MPSKPDLIIELDDGLPPASITRIEKPKALGPTALKYRAPAYVEITSAPVAVIISYARVRCLYCGVEHKDHRGIFVENHLSNGVRQMQRLSLRELSQFRELPRRVDEAPDEVVPICSACWLHEDAFMTAVIIGAAQGDLFGDVGQSKPIEAVIHALVELPEIESAAQDEIEITTEEDEQ